MSNQQERLRISEIFYSLQGESKSVGLPTVFVRLTGCPLRCQYCDTTYAFSGGEWMGIDAIVETVASYQTRYVTVTGGEPLAQKSCNTLLRKLCDAGYEVSLETSGAINMAEVEPRVIKIMDIKTPGSGEAEKNLYENTGYLDDRDQVKFVICNEKDYSWSKDVMKRYQLADKCEILFSPCQGELEARQLADWILRDRLAVRMQIQLHKYLWGNVPGK